MIVEGPGGVGDLKKSGKDSKQFGNLPDKLREKILQAGKQGFPPGYEKLLENYYKRLAEQATRKPPAPGGK